MLRSRCADSQGVQPANFWQVNYIELLLKLEKTELSFSQTDLRRMCLPFPAHSTSVSTTLQGLTDYLIYQHMIPDNNTSAQETDGRNFLLITFNSLRYKKVILAYLT